MLALLSNINTDFVLKTLSKDEDTVPPIGYGNIWGQLLDPTSILNQMNPDTLVFIIDIEELVSNAAVVRDSKEIISNWFIQFQSVLSAQKEYFISDVTYRSVTIEDNDNNEHTLIENYWYECLFTCMGNNKNVHLLKIKPIIEKIGKDSFYSTKLWYMGKIPYTNKATKMISNTIKRSLSLTNKTNKKILVLDLDNTLWGGILGEKGSSGIELSDDHVGAIYKDIQRKIKRMTKLGVMLGICSKNNEHDVDEVWEKNPHMVLRKNDFAAIKINWEDKADNLLQMANELNIGLDSFVFIDDMPNERENISLRIPEVVVPEFPSKVENYSTFIDSVFEEHFQHLKSTAEDIVKTKQYKENAQRKIASQGMTYEDFLISMKLKVDKVELNDNRMSRIVQLIGKTNQFNLTTKRYTRQDIDSMLNNSYKLYAYNISDKFGDYGLVAVVIVNLKNAMIDSFVMSCRVMGKLVENYIINDVENDLKKMNIKELHGEYIRTEKNMPVENFYDKLGYTIEEKQENSISYNIKLDEKPCRKYFVEE